jgi:class 3 adenylate cyclase/tetratricopeptide (TPR) repeat protein
MVRCPGCGADNPAGSRFCNRCGRSVAVHDSADVRKTVTVLFADVVSSTARAERADPESTRHLLARYFAAIRTVIEHHGGTVEKFIGDAVMAVFGVPTLHEDDALRAVLAARDVRTAVQALNAELAGSGWPPIALRTGVNSGEVVAGDAGGGETLVTGDAVNVAARLEQTAEPGEIVIGAATHRLVRDAVEVEPIPPRPLKGKASPVVAFRLLGVRERTADRHASPLVDRARELRLLADAHQRMADERACHLFTVLGSAGVGKSRLVYEHLASVGGSATILRTRCLPYGEGITFWPVAELVQAAAGIGPADSTDVARGRLDALLADHPEREAVVERVAATIGLSTSVVPAVESFWGVRKLLEWVARAGPLVVVIDDLHWAEPTLLDLIDHVSDCSRDAPILLLALARPELLEGRPQWGGGKLNATTILLEPLRPEDSAELIGNLVGDAELGRTVLERIGEKAEGNPLFVEELVTMLIEEGILRRVDGSWRATTELPGIHVPPTISALVAARLDRLEPSERDLIGRASVVGKVFQRSAVAELTPAERRDDLGSRLMALVRKELLRPDRSSPIGDEAFRFRHILVRDAAYAALPKEQRADLHARFADWLERASAGRLLEVEEVIAYHLEQAHDYRAELGLADGLTRTLGARAAARLTTAGRRALARDDSAAVENLLGRAMQLLEDPGARCEILFDLAHVAYHAGDMALLTARLHEAHRLAEEAGDELLVLLADTMRMDFQSMFDPGADDAALLGLADRLERLAAERDDRMGQACALVARSTISVMGCHWMDVLGTLERVVRLLDRATHPLLWREAHSDMANALRYGPVPAGEAVARIEAESAAHEDPLRLSYTAPLLAMQGRFAEAEERVGERRRHLEERGLSVLLGCHTMFEADVKRFAGDLEGASLALAEGIGTLRPVGETAVLSTLAAMQAMCLYGLGHRAGALEALQLARETGASNDVATQAGWRATAAVMAADEGRADEADELISAAIAMVEPTDFPELRAGVFDAKAHLEATAGRPDEARRWLLRALEEHERKGNLMDAARVRAALEGSPPDAAPTLPAGAGAR